MGYVICPVTGKSISKKDCLQHSIDARPAPCGYDFVVLNKMFHDSERTGIHTTDLLGCLRRSYFSKTQPAVEPVHAMLARTLGTITHGFLEMIHDDSVSELKLSYGGIVGTADLYYPNQKTLVDLKTTRWLSPAKLPYGEHETQVNIYAWMLEGNGFPVEELYVQYIDLSGPSKCRYCKILLVDNEGVLECPKCGRAPNDAHFGAALYKVDKMDHNEVGEFVERRKRTLELAIETGFIDAEPSYLCHYCAHVKLCPEGLQKTGL